MNKKCKRRNLRLRIVATSTAPFPWRAALSFAQTLEPRVVAWFKLVLFSICATSGRTSGQKQVEDLQPGLDWISGKHATTEGHGCHGICKGCHPFTPPHNYGIPFKLIMICSGDSKLGSYIPIRPCRDCNSNHMSCDTSVPSFKKNIYAQQKNLSRC